jgi:hypothetical protein
MQASMQSVLFSIHGHSFTRKDFLEILEYFGLLEEWRERLIKALTIQEYSESKNVALDVEQISHWSKEFRYERDLLNVEELNEWLNQRGLIQEDLEKYLIRRYWLEQDVDVTGDHKLVLKEMDLLTDIILSGSFDGLQFSWQKRLLSWFAKNDMMYEDFDELEKHFRIDEEQMKQECELSSWLKVLSKDLELIDLEIFKANSEDFSQSLSDMEYRGFYKDLPGQLKKIIHFQKVESLIGPELNEDGTHFWIKLRERQDYRAEQEAAEVFAFESYQEEVWKTLALRYVD